MATEGRVLDNQTRTSETVVSVKWAGILSMLGGLTVCLWAPAPCFACLASLGGGVRAGRALTRSLYLPDEIRHNSALPYEQKHAVHLYTQQDSQSSSVQPWKSCLLYAMWPGVVM